jgi:hypothetical protein
MEVEKFKTECQAFIFNWHRVTGNAKVLQKQFSDLGIATYVINSDEKADHDGLPNWVDIGESGYMVQQYAKALDIFDATYFVEMFADIYDVDAQLIVERACYTFSNYECGVYAPNVDYIAWDCDLARVPQLEEHLYEVPNPESLLTFIHRDVASGIALDPEHYTIGWGIDFLVSVLAHVQNRKVIRDYITTIRHPKGRGYDCTEAQKQFDQFIDDLDPDRAALMRQWIRRARDVRNMSIYRRVRHNTGLWLKGKIGVRPQNG